jgi:hypothetical protein
VSAVADAHGGAAGVRNRGSVAEAWISVPRDAVADNE